MQETPSYDHSRFPVEIDLGARKEQTPDRPEKNKKNIVTEEGNLPTKKLSNTHREEYKHPKDLGAQNKITTLEYSIADLEKELRKPGVSKIEKNKLEKIIAKAKNELSGSRLKYKNEIQQEINKKQQRIIQFSKTKGLRKEDVLNITNKLLLELADLKNKLEEVDLKENKQNQQYQLESRRFQSQLPETKIQQEINKRQQRIANFLRTKGLRTKDVSSIIEKLSSEIADLENQQIDSNNEYIKVDDQDIIEERENPATKPRINELILQTSEQVKKSAETINKAHIRTDIKKNQTTADPTEQPAYYRLQKAKREANERQTFKFLSTLEKLCELSPVAGSPFLKENSDFAKSVFSIVDFKSEDFESSVWSAMYKVTGHKWVEVETKLRKADIINKEGKLKSGFLFWGGAKAKMKEDPKLQELYDYYIFLDKLRNSVVEASPDDLTNRKIKVAEIKNAARQPSRLWGGK